MSRRDDEAEVMEARDVGYLLLIVPALLAVVGLVLDMWAGRAA
jgi:hypothetical protein